MCVCVDITRHGVQAAAQRSREQAAETARRQTSKAAEERRAAAAAEAAQRGAAEARQVAERQQQPQQPAEVQQPVLQERAQVGGTAAAAVSMHLTCSAASMLVSTMARHWLVTSSCQQTVLETRVKCRLLPQAQAPRAPASSVPRAAPDISWRIASQAARHEAACQAHLAKLQASGSQASLLEG